MASRKPRAVEVKPISINPNSKHRPEDDPDREVFEYLDSLDSAEPVQQTLEEARAEEAASRAHDATNGHQDPDDGSQDPVTVRIKLKWTPEMKRAATTAINDYLESAGAMPSILDLYEILKEDDAFAHTIGRTNHKGAPLFSPLSLQSGINAIRKQTAKDIANDIKLHGTTNLIPLASLARVQVERTKRVTDTRAISEYIASLPALKAKREAELAAAQGGNTTPDDNDGDPEAQS